MNPRSVVRTLPGGSRRRRLAMSLCVAAIALAALVVLISSLALAGTASFPDVPGSHPYYAAISDLASRGIIGGYANGDFGPADPVTRQQFAKMIVLAGGYPVSESDICQFTDVAKSDATTFYPDNYIAVCAARGVTAGKTATTFDPTGKITRYQVVSMVVRMADNLRPGLLGVPRAGWSGNAVWGADPTHGANALRAEYNGLLAGLVLAALSPSADMSRGEVAQVLHNLVDKLGTTTSSSAPGTTTTEATGDTNLGILRSTDHGVTWTSIGDAHMAGLVVQPADPTPVTVGGQVMLFFVDFNHLGDPVPQTLYRADSADGVNFDTPRAVYSQAALMVDPAVLRMANGSYRAYVPSGDEGIISAASADGLAFVRESGVRTNAGGMPGALLLPDNRVRLFVCGNGITSLISSDGLNFTEESGVRIAAAAGMIVDDPQPIRLANGTYLMLYQVRDSHAASQSGEASWMAAIHLATSTDGLQWTASPTIIGYGGTSCVVEMADGSLLIYYGH
jgi:hypothetical protein